jgi:hypothetical protein
LVKLNLAQSVAANGGEEVIGFKHLPGSEVPSLEPAIAALRADGIEPDPIITEQLTLLAPCAGFYGLFSRLL